MRHTDNSIRKNDFMICISSWCVRMKLPLELISYVCFFLDLRSIKYLSFACRYMRGIIYTNNVKLKIQNLLKQNVIKREDVMRALEQNCQVKITYNDINILNHTFSYFFILKKVGQNSIIKCIGIRSASDKTIRPNMQIFEFERLYLNDAIEYKIYPADYRYGLDKEIETKIVIQK
jgi:hypothetical protein